MRHRDCEVDHTSQQKFFLAPSEATVVALVTLPGLPWRRFFAAHTPRSVSMEPRERRILRPHQRAGTGRGPQATRQAVPSGYASEANYCVEMRRR